MAAQRKARMVRQAPAWAAAVLGAGLLAGCADCPPQVAGSSRPLVVQERGDKPELHAAMTLARDVLRRTQSDFPPDTMLQLVYDDLYAINATNLAWNWEQAWMLCVSYPADGDGAEQRHGVAMRVGPDGRPFHVSSVNWRDYTGAAC